MSDDLVEDYLDRLLARLRGSPRAVRRMLAEAEAHLLDAVADGVAGGLDAEAAQRAAIERFGSPEEVARRFARESPGGGGPAMVRDLVVAAARLGGVGLVAVGASGLVAWLFDALLGAGWVAGDTPGTTYTAARCADFLSYVPGARNCLDAAASHHAGEVVVDRLAAGVLGALVLLGCAAVTRRAGWGAAASLPRAVVPAVAATAFGLAAAALAVASVDRAALGWSGTGQALSAAIVSVVAAAWYALRTWRALAPAVG